MNDILKGEEFTLENIRSIRPGDGLPPKYLNVFLGKKARRKLTKGTPITWDMI